VKSSCGVQFSNSGVRRGPVEKDSPCFVEPVSCRREIRAKNHRKNISPS
jgi:hypothetical protein